MSRTTAGFVALELTFAISLAGVLVMSVGPRVGRMRAGMLETQVRSNCHVVQIAAETYALDHFGLYPSGVAGIVPYLPDGHLLLNPFTDTVMEPVDGTANSEGETGYVPINQWGLDVGYDITGFGSYRTIVQLSSFER